MKRITPGPVRGEIRAPSSKSMMQRAVAAATLAPGRSVLLCPSYSDDGRAALRVARALGATVLEAADFVRISGGGVPTGEPLDCGEAGFSIRMFSAIAALFDRPIELIAHGSLMSRPMDMILGPLRELGASVESDEGRPPLRIRGPIRGGGITVDGSLSSQFISGLLLALPLCPQDSTLRVPELKSKPYVRMTLSLLREFGVRAEADAGLTEFRIPGGQQYRPATYTVEGDWSGAAFLLVAGATAGRLTVTNLRQDSLQADREILTALRRAGALVEFGRERVTVESAPLHGFEFDASDCPDLFPPLVALAAHCSGHTRLRGASRLLHKESNRAHALELEFGKLGIEVRVEGDWMQVRGGRAGGGSVFSHHDHRIAMACAVAGLTATGDVQIEAPGCVAKSYEEFFEDLEKIREKP